MLVRKHFFHWALNYFFCSWWFLRDPLILRSYFALPPLFLEPLLSYCLQVGFCFPVTSRNSSIGCPFVSDSVWTPGSMLLFAAFSENSNSVSWSSAPHHLVIRCLFTTFPVPSLLLSQRLYVFASLWYRCYCFIDYAKAFDCVDYHRLWKILKEMGIPDHLTCLLRNLYGGQEATVRLLDME